MTTNFPTSLDAFTNPSATDAMDSATVPHATQHANLNDAVEALQAKVGVDGSAVTTSLDYKVAQQGLVLLSETSLTTGSAYTINNVFSSTYRDYVIVGSFDRTTSGTDTNYCFIELGGTQANCSMSGQYQAWVSGTINGDYGNAPYCFITNYGSNSFVANVWAPNLPAYSYISSVGNSVNYTTTTNVKVSNSTQFTGFEFVLANGTFQNGKLSVYGRA